jgi:7-cyano-7-deazaguanine synthase
MRDGEFCVKCGKRLPPQGTPRWRRDYNNREGNMPGAIVLLSGGLDSATVLAIARAGGYDCRALSFSYGQRHSIELNAAAAIAAAADVPWTLIEIDLRAFGGSALTADEIDVPKHDSPEQLDASKIPATYVPCRNTIFFAYALAVAEVESCDHIFAGMNALDYSGYPDCRPEYIDAFQTMAGLASKRAVEGHRVTIHTPLLQMGKREIVATGRTLGVDYSMTHSCYDPAPDGAACGRCDSCLLRHRAFVELELPDPTRYVRQAA